MITQNRIYEPRQLKKIDRMQGRVYVTPEGNTYPSVTTILSDEANPAIEDWRARVGNTKANSISAQACARGEAVHQLAEYTLNNFAIDQKDYSAAHWLLFSSLRLHLRKISNVVFTETALYSDILKCAGTVDCVAEVNGVLSIIDFKTATHAKDAENIENYFIQATAYALMMKEMYDADVKQLVIIMAVEKGYPLMFTRQVDDYIDITVRKICEYHLRRKNHGK